MKKNHLFRFLISAVLFLQLSTTGNAQNDCNPRTRISSDFTRVYIALRNGADGSGKMPEDARDGSTVEKFDRILRCFSEGCDDPATATGHIQKRDNLIVCLSPGMFRTKGTYDFLINIPHKSAEGFTVGRGWKIHGAGKDKTTLQLADFLPIQSLPNPQNAPAHTGMGVVIGTNSDGASDIEVSDLTIDAGYPELKRRAAQTGIKALNLNAIQLRSDRGHNWIHDVHVMRTAGEIGAIDPRFETFPVWIYSVRANSSPTDNSGNIIERVTMTDYAGGACTAIAVANATGEVRNNRVEGYEIGYGGWVMGPVYFHDNVAEETDYGFNIDSLANKGVRIEHNKIIHPRSYGIVVGGSGSYDGFLIRDNTVEINRPRVIALVFRGNVTNAVVADNKFLANWFSIRATAIRSYRGERLAGPNGDNSFQGNAISEKLRIMFSDGTKEKGDCMAGNHDEQGRPLRDMPDNHAGACAPAPAVSH